MRTSLLHESFSPSQSLTKHTALAPFGVAIFNLQNIVKLHYM